MHFSSKEQENLMEELYNTLTDSNKLKELLNKHKNNQDPKKGFSSLEDKEKSKVHQHSIEVLCNNRTICKRTESLLLDVGST